MIEAQGDLGGYAVPPNVQSEIMKRLPGLTVVRGAGATVITLANGNSVDIPEYTGGNDRYVGALRGAWGNETKSPGAKNATVGLVQLTANIYTYKIPMSQTLVEDAVNLLALIQTDISDVMAMDEDDAYLIGDGVGKPYGILPGSTNALSLTEVNSGSASVLTTQGIKALKRGIAAQYRKSGVYVGNSDTFGAVERFQSTDGKFIFDDLTDTNMLAGRRVFESEAMPDIAANAYPLLFCDMSGYTIVERLGLTIARYQDSYTGINVVEYQVRRRVGGRLAKPWLFSVQKVSA
jgi:HK97 family phage major capsid protein